MNDLDLLKFAAPETILLITVLAVLAADLWGLRELELRFRLIIGGMISCVGWLAAHGWMVGLPQEANLMKGISGLTPFIKLVTMSLGILTPLTILISIDANLPRKREW